MTEPTKDVAWEVATNAQKGQNIQSNLMCKIFGHLCYVKLNGGNQHDSS